MSPSVLSKTPSATRFAVSLAQHLLRLFFYIYSFLLFSSKNCILFVLQSPGTLNHVESMSLDGRKTKGALFGYAMAVAGDLNKDGFSGRTKL